MKKLFICSLVMAMTMFALSCSDDSKENPQPSPSDVPAKVTNVKMDSKTGILTWDKAKGAKYYELHYISRLLTGEKYLGDAEETNFATDEDWKNTWHKYIVYAVNEAGKSEASNVIEGIWLDGKTVLNTPELKDFSVKDSVRVSTEGKKIDSWAFTTVIDTKDENAKHLQINATTYIKTDEYTATSSKQGTYNLSKLEPISGTTYSIVTFIPKNQDVLKIEFEIFTSAAITLKEIAESPYAESAMISKTVEPNKK